MRDMGPSGVMPGMKDVGIEAQFGVLGLDVVMFGGYLDLVDMSVVEA